MTKAIHQARTNYSHDEHSQHLIIEAAFGEPRLGIVEDDERGRHESTGIYMNKAQWLELAAAATQIAADMDDSPKGSPTAEHLKNDDVLQWQDENRRAAFEQELQNILDVWATFTWNDRWASAQVVYGTTDAHFDTLIERGHMEQRVVRGRIEFRITAQGRAVAKEA